MLSRLKLTGLGWSFDDIPSQSGKRAVVTGANSGIGFEVCKQLLQHDLCELVMGSRNMELVEHAAQDLREQFPSARIVAKHLDLGDFSSVRSFADEVLADNKPIHLLINDAGRYIDTPFEVTKDGFEVQMKTNYYAHVYLTHLLLPQMIRTKSARIVILSSMAEMFGKLDWDDLKGEKVGTSGMAAYGRSKLFLLMFSYELDRRLKLAGADVNVYATHPGLVRTGLFDKVDFRYPFAVISFVQGLLIGLDPVGGSMSTLYAATKPTLPGGTFTGPSYIFNTGTTLVGKPWNPTALKADAQVKLYDATMDILRDTTGTDIRNFLPAASVN